MKKSVIAGKLCRVSIITAALLCNFAFAALAANSEGKPATMNEVPGNWSVDMSDTRNLWFSDANWDGKPLTEYSPEVRKLFPDPDPSLFGDHPDFTDSMRANENDPNGTIRVLDNREMNGYLNSLPNQNLTMRYIGDFPSGIRMPLLVFSKPKLTDPTGENLRALGKPIFYLRAQIHGNENAATAGAIMLAQRLANNHPDLDGVLDKISIIILPRMNADGTKLHQRGTTLVSGDSWGTGAPDFNVSTGPGGGASEYGGGIMGGLDQNRDNLWLSAPASRANARILAEYKPEICLDAHEYECNSWYGIPLKVVSGDSFAYVTDPDKGNRIVMKDPGGTLVYYKEQITTQWANHLIIPKALRDISETIQQKIAAGLQDDSNPTGPYYWAPYVDTRGYGLKITDDGVAAGGLIPLNRIPEGPQREAMAKWADANRMVPEFDAIIQSVEGGFDPSIARNSMALIPGISFLVESRSAGGRWEFARRVMGQYLTTLYYIRAVLDDLDAITASISSARADTINAGKPENVGREQYKMTISQTYRDVDYSDVVTQGVYYHDGTSEDIFGVRKNSRFGTIPTFEATRPLAYVMDSSYLMADEIAFRMSNLGIAFERTVEPITLDVNAYTVTAATPVTSFGATCRITGVSEAAITRTFPAGSYVFYMEQQMANFIALLFEPMSLRSWIGKDVRNVDVILNKEVPFYRYMKTERIAKTEASDIPTLDFTDAFLFRAKPYDIETLTEAREQVGSEGYAQTMTLYGALEGVGTIRAYLPSNGDKRSWYVLEKGVFVKRDSSFSSEMNRHYIEIEAASLQPRGNNYYSFELFVAPAGIQIDSPGTGGGCNAGATLVTVLVLLSIALRRRD